MVPECVGKPGGVLAPWLVVEVALGRRVVLVAHVGLDGVGVELGDRRRAEGVAEIVEPDTAKAGLRRVRFHDLRHAFGSAAITKLDPYAVQSYMGHQHYSTTQRYLHHKPRREDAAALQEAFGRNASETEPASPVAE